MRIRTRLGIAGASVLIEVITVAGVAQAQAVAVRKPARVQAPATATAAPNQQHAVAAAATPTPFPQRPMAARATTLLILVSGSSGDESGVWGKSLGVSTPLSITLGLTAFSEYASLLWEAASRPPEDPDAVILKTGHVTDAAAPGELLVMALPLQEFLPPGRPPESPEEYFIRVTTLDADHNKVGTSNSVRVVYATDNALRLPSVAFAPPGEAVRVNQSCEGSRTRVVLCVADSRLGWDAPRCSSADFSCLPYSCHKGGVTCNSACLDDSDCVEPARCYGGRQSESVGECVFPEPRCSDDGSQIISQFDSIDCSPYACLTTEIGVPYCVCRCESSLDCDRAHGYACSSVNTCILY